MKNLTDTERLTLSKIQRKIEKVGGIENLVDSDVIAELKRGIEQGHSKEGVFYRIMDVDELRRWMANKPFRIYKFVSRNKRANEESYGYRGLIQVEIKGKVVPYESGEEGEMLLYSTRRLKLIKVFEGQ